MDAGEYLVEALEKVSYWPGSSAAANDSVGGRKRRLTGLWRSRRAATGSVQNAWPFGRDIVDRNVGSVFANGRQAK